ncbi:hypothetical protein ABZ413_17235 [Nocardia rhamnosiphila]|uniref:hypothetical protein n=1 Tax=Nocardia rhamnosiphila TaxID=426716 RepID=UPI0033F43CC3
MDGSERWDETWHRLLGWTDGQGPSERLAAQLLAAEGYQDIDPSHPLGGKDGGRDATCTKDGRDWIMAVYFPRGQQSLSEIKKKLTDDLASAAEHAPYGVAFVTNQELRLSERRDLEQLGGQIRVKLFHLERITTILDQPAMASVRWQFLKIGSSQPAIEVELEIVGEALCFTNGEAVREHYLEETAKKAREQAEQKSPPAATALLRNLPQFSGTPKPRTADEVERRISRWEKEVRQGWAQCEGHLAAAVGPALHLRLTNNSKAMLNAVQIIITMHGVRGFDWLGTEHLDWSKVLPPVFPRQRDPYFGGMDSTFLQTVRWKGDPIGWENKGDAVIVTIDLEYLRPHPTWESPQPDVVLVLADNNLTEVTAEWTLTTQGHGEVYRGEPVSIPVRALSMADAVRSVTSKEDD